MSIDKLEVFASQADKNTDGLTLKYGFPSAEKPARQWFNWLFYTQTAKINEVVDLTNTSFTRIKDMEVKYEQLRRDTAQQLQDTQSSLQDVREYADQLMQTAVGGKLAYKTYAEMVEDKSNIVAKSSIDVIADTDDKNGTYLYDGTNFVKSQYDLEKIIRAKVQNTFGTYAQMVASDLSDGAYALVADDADDKNGLFIKTAGTWSKSHYNAADIAKAVSDKAFRVFEDSLISKGDNLFDVSEVQSRTGIDASTGEKIESTQYAVSGVVPVKPDTEYTVSAITAYPLRWVFHYDANMNYIGRTEHVSGIEEVGGNVRAITFKTLKKTHYIILMNSITSLRANVMLVEGTEWQQFDPYYRAIDKLPIPASSIVGLTDEVLNKGVMTGRLDKLLAAADSYTLSSNLLTMIGVTPDVLVRSDGTYGSNSDYALTDFIPVNGQTQYTGVAGNAVTFLDIAYYDANQSFLSRQVLLSSNITKEGLGGQEVYAYRFTTPVSASFVRINFKKYAIEREVGLFEGNEAKVYTPPKPVVSNIILGDDVISSLDIKQNRTGHYFYNHSVQDAFEITRGDWNGYPDGWNRPKASYVYGIYDALMAQYPDYITKKVLGVDDFGNIIALYKFKPKEVRVNTTIKRAKVFLTCSTHGYEHVPPLATYLMMKEVCEHWKENPQLEVIRKNVELLVIPVVNPSGFDVFSRENGNGVDINRDMKFGADFDDTDRQKESLYIKQVFDENPDINVMYDFHNFHGSEGSTDYIWTPANNDPYVASMGVKLVNRMSSMWSKRYDWLADDVIVGYSEIANDNPERGLIKTYAKSRGVDISATFELCSKWNIIPPSERVMWDEMHCKTMTEAITNWILISLEALQDLNV